MPSEDRLRSLAHITHHLRAAGDLEDHIQRLLEQQPGRLEVLEVGFGYGRALLELSWLFRDRDAGFHGVDLNRYVDGPEQLRAIAETYQLIPSEDLSTARMPALYHYDATRLQFADESLDFVFSAITIRFMRDKALFIEEVSRVLRPGGTAILHISEGNWDYPHGLASDDRVLTPFTSRLVLRHDRELIPLADYLRLFEGGPFIFRLTPQTRCILQLEKLASGSLSLALRFNEQFSATGRSLPLRDRRGKVRGGYRTVYDVSRERYQELLDRGIIHEISAVPMDDAGSRS
jgi:ubiquinone/menaquinone biosynthesis C-methylase UbiE